LFTLISVERTGKPDSLHKGDRAACHSARSGTYRDPYRVDPLKALPQADKAGNIVLPGLRA
jgi:hypothetical protein